MWSCVFSCRKPAILYIRSYTTCLLSVEPSFEKVLISSDLIGIGQLLKNPL